MIKKLEIDIICFEELEEEGNFINKLKELNYNYKKDQNMEIKFILKNVECFIIKINLN